MLIRVGDDPCAEPESAPINIDVQPSPEIEEETLTAGYDVTVDGDCDASKKQVVLDNGIETAQNQAGPNAIVDGEAECVVGRRSLLATSRIQLTLRIRKLPLAQLQSLGLELQGTDFIAEVGDLGSWCLGRPP